MSTVVPVASKVRVVTQPHCQEVELTYGEGVTVETRCEHLIYMQANKAGNDGILLGVCETPEAAEAITTALNQLLSLVHTHV